MSPYQMYYALTGVRVASHSDMDATLTQAEENNEIRERGSGGYEFTEETGE